MRSTITPRQWILAASAGALIVVACSAPGSRAPTTAVSAPGAIGHLGLVPNEHDAERIAVKAVARIVAALGPVALYSTPACVVLVGAFSSVVLFRGG